jgi:hypothetical protein
LGDAFPADQDKDIMIGLSLPPPDFLVTIHELK